MSLLVRKIDKAKWSETELKQGSDIPADAITNCLKTRGNALSVWRVEEDSEIDEAVLAIVSGQQHLETFDVVPMSADYLEKNGIEIIGTQGDTPVEDLKQKHMDLTNLSYRRLGTIAFHIVDRFGEQRVQRYTQARLRQILKEAIQRGRLTPDQLGSAVRDKL